MAASTDGGNTYLVATIPPVGADLAEITLNDLKVVSPEGGLISALSVHLMTFNSNGRLEGDYCYLDENTYEEFCAPEPGWYDADSAAIDYEPIAMGTENIAAGRMFIILSDCGAKITVPAAIEK